MDSFLLALQFLTTLPLKIKGVSEKKIASSMVYFPFVGLFLGLVLSGIYALLCILNLSALAANIILTVALIIITGGLHLDGLSDTADAFLSGKPKDEMLAIMRDSHVGVMGALSLIGIILLKIGLLSSISAPLKTISLLLMCILSRWSLVWAMFLFPYARQEGKAKIFTEGINLKIFILATVITLVCAILTWRLRGLLILGIVAMGVYAINKFINHKLGGITGDTLGATSEIVEVITLFSICLLQGVNLWIR